ncbi:hypothetical protein BKA81DRAFT_344056 [Phyllosticta paracitricarpa]
MAPRHERCEVSLGVAKDQVAENPVRLGRRLKDFLCDGDEATNAELYESSLMVQLLSKNLCSTLFRTGGLVFFGNGVQAGITESRRFSHGQVRIDAPAVMIMLVISGRVESVEQELNVVRVVFVKFNDASPCFLNGESGLQALAKKSDNRQTINCGRKTLCFCSGWLDRCRPLTGSCRSRSLLGLLLSRIFFRCNP